MCNVNTSAEPSLPLQLALADLLLERRISSKAKGCIHGGRPDFAARGYLARHQGQEIGQESVKKM